MGGIINYFHGETGRVLKRSWIDDGSSLTYSIQLSDNPHRSWAFDYDSDIGIDPAILPGDRVVYVRTDPSCGIWVREGEHFFPSIDAVFARTARNRSLRGRRGRTPSWQTELENTSGVPVVVRGASDPTLLSQERAATEASFFISYSSVNVMVARQVYRDLRADAKATVWLDLAEGSEGLGDDEKSNAWLRGAVYACRGFILLWTRASAASVWVAREIAWAKEQAARDPSFHLIVLKMDETPLPTAVVPASEAIDCNELWWGNVVHEELFALLYRRTGRRAWLHEHERRGLRLDDERRAAGYEQFMSDAGVARQLMVDVRDGTLHWNLVYERHGELLEARETGHAYAIDFDIKPGDRVGTFLSERGPVWMRSHDLAISPDSVLTAYFRRLNKLD